MAELTASSRFCGLRSRGLDRLHAGDLLGALASFESAREAAVALGDLYAIDVAYCDWSGLALELGRGEECLPVLRRMLSLSQDLNNRRRAAYNIARIFELDQSIKKSLFYARVALQLAKDLRRPECLARSHNQMGNLLLAESRLSEAVDHYEQALDFMPEEEDLDTVPILTNLGYCRSLHGRHSEAFELLARARGLLSRTEAAHLWIPLLLASSFAYLDTRSLEECVRHAQRALDLAGGLGDTRSMTIAHYLLGQAAVLSGDRDAARLRFLQLQREFFPDIPNLVSLLLSVDLTPVLNLRA